MRAYAENNYSYGNESKYYVRDRKQGIRMGLDIYAGTLTRYYAGNWKNVVQMWAEANGYTFNKITPDGQTISRKRRWTREK